MVLREAVLALHYAELLADDFETYKCRGVILAEPLGLESGGEHTSLLTLVWN